VLNHARILCDAQGHDLPRSHLLRLAWIRNWQLSNMSAQHWRLYAPVDADGGCVLWRDETWNLEPGHWLLIAPHTAASTEQRADFRKAYHHFTWVPRGLRPRPGIYRGRIARDQARRLRALAGQYDEHSSQLALVLHALTAEALAGLPASAFEAETRYGALVGDAIAIMHRRLAEAPNNGAIAAELGLHPGSFVRLFSRETGTSPQRFCMELRLEHGAALLLETDDSMEAIAAACGFGDRHHFSRAFAAQWSVPPARYRRQARG
jgi:AraC-like DNA-binding protein